MSSATGRGGETRHKKQDEGEEEVEVVVGVVVGVDVVEEVVKKESILELAKLVDSSVRVKCLGGRELRGALRGYDELVNLVLDDCEEFLRDPEDPEQVTNQTRKLGLVVIRGTQVSLVSPEEGTEEIANPFLGGAEEEEMEG